ncbi:hypothetical protein QYF61_007608 [Mycteria americana]|uniref:Uncharacterized protein n=1 Tax=Mycteria americana TaxID=33587 RepID=A0AAN7NUE7_MYCAM|nr:hypothetical protein QYF61_007608 [Mycteria americana]
MATLQGKLTCQQVMKQGFSVKGPIHPQCSTLAGKAGWDGAAEASWRCRGGRAICTVPALEPRCTPRTGCQEGPQQPAPLPRKGAYLEEGKDCPASAELCASLGGTACRILMACGTFGKNELTHVQEAIGYYIDKCHKGGVHSEHGIRAPILGTALAQQEQRSLQYAGTFEQNVDFMVMLTHTTPFEDEHCYHKEATSISINIGQERKPSSAKQIVIQETFKIIESNCKPKTAKSTTKPCGTTKCHIYMCFKYL